MFDGHGHELQRDTFANARVSAMFSVVRALYRTVNGEKELPLDTVYTGEDGRFSLPVPVREVKNMRVGFGVRQMVEVSVMSHPVRRRHPRPLSP